jgi:hypothetical protein
MALCGLVCVRVRCRCGRASRARASPAFRARERPAFPPPPFSRGLRRGAVRRRAVSARRRVKPTRSAARRGSDGSTATTAAVVATVVAGTGPAEAEAQRPRIRPVQICAGRAGGPCVGAAGDRRREAVFPTGGRRAPHFPAAAPGCGRGEPRRLFAPALSRRPRCMGCPSAARGPPA